MLKRSQAASRKSCQIPGIIISASEVRPLGTLHALWFQFAAMSSSSSWEGGKGYFTMDFLRVVFYKFIQPLKATGDSKADLGTEVVSAL